MKRYGCWRSLVILILATMVLFTGCRPRTGTVAIVAKQILRVAVHESRDHYTEEALEQMAKTLMQISGGRISLTYAFYDDPLQAIQAGEAELVVMTTDALAFYGSHLEMLSSPFFFRDSLHASMTMNSQDFHALMDDYIREKTGCVYLQSVFSQSDYLLSDSLPLITEDALEEQRVWIYPQNPTLLEVLLHHGAKVEYLPQDLEIPSDSVLQYSPQVPMGFLPFEGKSRVYLPNSPALTISQWIMAEESFWNGLTTTQKSLMREAISYFTAYCEEPRMEKEQNLEYAYARKETSLHWIDGEALRKSMQNYFKSNEQYKNRWDATLYSSIQLIIR